MIVITRTPLRISFFGGGTDYSPWVRKNGGAVLSTTINKYSYLYVQRNPPFFPYKSKIIYSRIEEINSLEEINHPSVRETLRFLNFQDGVAIHYNGDVPARSGMGSSSSFTIGLLHALYGLRGINPDKKKLASEAIYIEQKKIKENVGAQDQVACAYGGLNKIDFFTDESFGVTPLNLKPERIEELENHMLLFFTGFSRTASEIAEEQIQSIDKKFYELKLMRGMVDEAISVLQSSGNWLDRFGKLLDETWKLKRSLTSKISNSDIDYFYECAMREGALGGKLLGAGGGGFLLIFAKPENHIKIKNVLSKLLNIPFKFENEGTKIIYSMNGD